MLNERLVAARRVADDLFKFEKALDDAISLGAQFSSGLLVARQTAKLSAVVGQDALDGIMKTLTVMVKARGELIETHHHLKVVADDIGLRTVSFGGLVKPPRATSADETHLQAVA